MKSFFTFLFIGFTFYQASAQVKAFAPLSCYTWGVDQFLDFETVQRLGPFQPPYTAGRPYNATSYQSFGEDREVYSWLADDQRYQYINNVQVIRWNINDRDTRYKITVSDMFDEEFYSLSTENSCGIIIFPDSIEAQKDVVFVKIRTEDQRNMRAGINVINFGHVELHPKDKAKRLSILQELQSCTSLECKIEKLKAHNALLDILSLLELEKMKDRQNKDIDKLHWEIVSQIRYEFSVRSWER